MKKMLKVIGCIALILGIFTSSLQYGKAVDDYGMVNSDGLPIQSGVWIEKDGNKYYVFCIDPEKAYPGTGVKYEESGHLPEDLSPDTISKIERALTVLSPLNAFHAIKNDGAAASATQNIIWGYISEEHSKENLTSYNFLKVTDGFTIEAIRDYIENGTPLKSVSNIGDISLRYDESQKAYVGTTDFNCGHSDAHEPIFDQKQLPDGLTVRYNTETKKVEVKYTGQDLSTLNGLEVSYQNETYSKAENLSLFIPLPMDQQDVKNNKEYQRMFGYEIKTEYLNGSFHIEVPQSGNINISKTVVSQEQEAFENEFVFNIQLSDTTINQTFQTILSGDGVQKGTVEFVNGKAAVTLKDGQNIEIVGLPYGIQYNIQEEAMAGFVSESVNNFGTIEQAKTSYVEFVNTFGIERTHIVIEKIWEDEDDTSRPENIYVELFADGVSVGTHMLSKDTNWRLTIDGLRKYQDDHETLVDYEVHEYDVDGYELLGIEKVVVDEVATYTMTNRIVEEDEVLGDDEEPETPKEETETPKEDSSQPVVDEDMSEDEVLGDIEVPNTGDSIPLELCLGALVLSGIAIVLIVLRKKKK